MAAIRSIVSCCILFVIVSLVGCGGGTPAQSTSPLPDTGTLHTSTAFPDGCVATGSANARRISNPDFKLEGPNALGAAGDYLLANDRALFVISGIGPQKTYYHYGGILVDAVAIDQCEQAADEEFFEMALMLGRLNPFVQSQSSFRAFNAHNIEVINDGSNGQAAVIRATGTDDYYWLLELTLMARGVLAGKPKYLSQPFGFEVVVDYILEPDSPTLKIEYRIVNQLNGFNNLTIAFVLLSSGNGAPLHTFSSFDLNVEGLDLQYGIPWVTASNGQGSYVYGTNSEVLTTTQISGVDALLDAKQLANTYLGSFLTANGTPGDTLLQEYFVTVSAGDELAAVNAHLAHTPKKIRTISTPVSGTVVDTASGNPVANAKIEFQTRKQNFLSAWPWETFISTYSDDNGFFGGDIPLLHYLDTQGYRLVVSAAGRTDMPPVIINPAQSQHFSLAFAGQGAVQYQFVDQHGVASPAQVSFYQNGKLQLREYTIDGEGSIALPPGEYEAVVSRGFEYAIVEKRLTVTDGTPAHLSATLVRMVNTDGYLSLDAHVHSAPSPDSDVSPQLRIRTAVATGLEVMVATDHEIFTDLSPAAAALNMQSQIATIVGQEVTASIPNHTIAYPFAYDATQVRQFVAWHGLDIAQIFALEKSMGAQIRTFAHPRSDYLELIQWDRIKGAPGEVDPAHLGLPADATLWSWDFEAMEYMNGTQNVFSSGIFEDWMSFLNHGHRIVATGASDVHDLDIPGMPRSYFKSPTDSPAQFAEQHLVDAIKQGQVVVSTGAFAQVQANGVADMGDTVTDTDGSLALFVHVEAIPQIDVDHLRIYVNCDEVARVTATNPADSAVKYSNSIAVPIPVTTDAHVVVLGFGQQRLPAEFQQFDPAEVPRFTTNPVYVDTDGDGVFQAPGGKTCAI